MSPRNPSRPDDHVQIGALARATGITVRTLHHYDAIGLLVPDDRSYSGRRLYSEQDVRRLYQIVALRQLGLSLDEIGSVLDHGADLTGALRRHLARVDEGLSMQRRLRETLSRMLELLDQQRQPSLDQFVQSIQETTMIEKYYTESQQRQLAARGEALGDAGLAQAERDWATLIGKVKAEQAAGTDPTDARVLELAQEWRALIERFTGGDQGLRDSLAAMYREQGAASASRGSVDAELMRYVNLALQALP